MSDVYKGILVCGGRQCSQEIRTYVFSVLSKLDPSFVISGGATGVDSYAQYWCDTKGRSYIVVPASWTYFGRKAGPIRNAWMIKLCKKLHVTALLAFPGGKGTKDCTCRAEKAGMRVLLASEVIKEMSCKDVK